MEISIHPMLKLIVRSYFFNQRFHYISIHPMLKLIASIIDTKREAYINFNTSHVKVNLYGVHGLCNCSGNFNTSHVKVNPTYFQHSIQYTIPDSPVFINILKFFTSRRALCQKNSQNHCNTTVFADSRNFTLIGGW